MKLLIIGSDSNWAIEKLYCSNLNELGIETTIFSTKNYYKSTLYFKILFHLRLNFMFSELNSQLIDYCKNSKPDYVFIFKGIEIFPKSLRIIKSLGVKTLNFNPDHPFLRYYSSHGGKDIPKSLPLYDLIFTYNFELLNNLQELFKKKTVLLPFGYNQNLKIDFNFELREEKIKICFIGYLDNPRIKMLNFIAESGLSIDVYSSFKRNFFKKLHHRINLFDEVFDNNYIDVIQSYRVQLNLLRKHNSMSHNQRTFEVPGAGGILLSEYTYQQSQFFKEDKEIFFFRSKSDLIKKLNFILNLDRKTSITIRKSAIDRSVKSKYSYRERARVVMRELTNIK
jgi:spore maturation protein CgeB